MAIAHLEEAIPEHHGAIEPVETSLALTGTHDNHQGRMTFHPTRFDDTAGPVGLFFLHYYPLILVVLGLALFGVLQFRNRKKSVVQ